MTSIKINTPSDEWEYTSDYSHYSSYYFSYAFDESETSYFRSGDVTTGGFFRFDPIYKTIVDKVRIKAVAGYGASSIGIYGSTDAAGTTRTLLDTITPSDTSDWQDFTFTNTTEYDYYWFELQSFYGASQRFYEIELWGPTAPSDPSSALTKINSPSDTYSTTFNTYASSLSDAFDEDEGTGAVFYTSGIPGDIVVEFSIPKICNALRFLNSTGSDRGVKGFTLYGSNDGTSYTEIASGEGGDSFLWQFFDFENTVGYTYYRFTINSHWGGSWLNLYELELFGEEGGGSSGGSSGSIPLIILL